MRFSSLLLGFLLVAPSVATFNKDVVGRRGAAAAGNKKPAFANKESMLRSSMLSKAVPLAEYEAKMGTGAVSRRLEDGENDEDMYSFSGFSMKYAKCQPVQLFSEEAVEDGMRSPLVSEDIVILRLCPQTSCSQSIEYGCYYNYAEYALTLSDYLETMMEYKQTLRESTCDYCEACLNDERRLEDEEGDNDEDGDEDQDNEDQSQDEDEDGNEDDADEDEDQNQGYDAENNNCGDDWDTYCSDYQYMCGDGEQDDAADGYNGNSQYNDYDFEQVEEYMECTEVDYNDYAYFIKPRCNGSTGAIEFAVYYDNYCVESASDKVSINSLGLGLTDSIFYQFYNGECIDCSESEYGPYYDTSSNMCNEIHQEGAKCTSALMYEIFDGEDDEDTECSFIESLRFGAYDEEGQLTSNLDGSSWDYEPTTQQQVLLGVSIFFSIAFIIYACYLHHAMTNLLIKSLSHRELLPPSRHSSRRNPTKRRSTGRSRKVGDEGDWGEEP